jgi:2-polyprenyl-3-methyl-5-hydroxy-6-metoxy-1,4-benzoquinol methylase
MNQDYSDYKEWKGWGRGNAATATSNNYFDAEVFSSLTNRPKELLEVGFGNGEFLDWAKNQNLKVTGIEIIPELVSAATSRGIEAYQVNLASGSVDDSLQGRKFDCIVAFDVIEHLSVDEIRTFLRRLSKMLNDQGRVILRFPNGESPFSMPLFNGDHTHRSWLCRSKLEHLCISTGLELERYRNASRVANQSRHRYVKRLLFVLRDLIEVVIGYTYYSKRLPLDPNAIAILKKTDVVQ